MVEKEKTEKTKKPVLEITTITSKIKKAKLAPKVAKGRRAVKGMVKQQVIGFRNRTIVFPPNVRVEITEAEFKSREFQARKKYFMEVS